MEPAPTTSRLTASLAADHRVLTLDGLAVLAHGHTRPTYDADIWLDPTLPPEEWAGCLRVWMGGHPSLGAVEIGSWRTIDPCDLKEVIERDGVLRIMGAKQPLDIFRRPNELPVEEFDAVWERATPLEDGTRVPCTVDLLMTKQMTGRDKDMLDIQFLENKAEQEYLRELPVADLARATFLLSRFLTPKVAEAAARHAIPAVRELGLRYLRELAADGDPFAVDLLKEMSA